MPEFPASSRSGHPAQSGGAHHSACISELNSDLSCLPWDFPAAAPASQRNRRCRPRLVVCPAALSLQGGRDDLELVHQPAICLGLVKEAVANEEGEVRAQVFDVDLVDVIG